MSSTQINTPPPTRPLSVVLADDMVEIRYLIDHWLTEAGHHVRCAASGREVARLVRDQPVDLIITDILMPDEDGLCVIMDARRAHPEARLLAISGGGLHMPATACLTLAKGLGAHGVLLKPFSREELLEAVNRVTQSGA